MQALLIHLRAMNLFAHSAHNLVGRVPFHQDHEFFGEIYPIFNSDYDDVAERIIGLFGESSLNINDILSKVLAKVQTLPSIGVKENSLYYQVQLKLEQELCSLIAQIIASGASEGTKQLLGDICNASESRQYKIKQRIKK